ncbi:MAG: dihydrolipoyl dehydrogenase family protein, partial [Candidatus Micrarchaeota archaeon]
MVMGELATKTDVVVIGGGPGGYTAAIRAAKLGMQVVLVEKGELGGVCTNVGCIPTKALIHASEMRRQMGIAKAMGLEAEVKLDFSKTQQWKEGIVERMRDGVKMLLRMNGVEVVKGDASFESARRIGVHSDSGGRAFEFNKAVIATGTVVKAHPTIPFDHDQIIDSDDALSLREVPKRIAIVGGGYIAVEMACMFLGLGSKVTIIYRGERLVKSLEPEMSALLAKRINDMGGQVLFKSDVVSAKEGKAIVKGPDGESAVGFDRLLIAIGREVSFEGLGLQNTRIALKDGRIAVDHQMRTSEPDIFAVGDAVPGPQLAHKAFREGKVAAETIAGQKSAFDNVAVPMVVFSNPTMASVGMTEEQAKAGGHDIVIGKMPF